MWWDICIVELWFSYLEDKAEIVFGMIVEEGETLSYDLFLDCLETISFFYSFK
jgi:hypothetical protein